MLAPEPHKELMNADVLCVENDLRRWCLDNTARGGAFAWSVPQSIVLFLFKKKFYCVKTGRRAKTQCAYPFAVRHTFDAAACSGCFTVIQLNTNTV